MGVKVKTPTPFIGAGQIGTMTPNLTGPWTAISEVADDVLQGRFEDRKNSAIEQGKIDSHGLITYDDNGNLNPLSNLPSDTSYYSQSVKANASLSYFQSLESDLANFTTKTLMQFPNDSMAVKEQLEIYGESARTDLDPSLLSGTDHLLKITSDKAILQAQGNALNQLKTDVRINSANTIEKTVTRINDHAINNNAPLWQHDEDQIKTSLSAITATGEGKTTPAMDEESWAKIVTGHKIHKDMYPIMQHLKQIAVPMESFNVDAVNNAREQAFNIKTKVLNSYSKQEDKDAFNTLYKEKMDEAWATVQYKTKITNEKTAIKYQMNNMELNDLVETGAEEDIEFLIKGGGLDLLNQDKISYTMLKTLQEKVYDKVQVEQKEKNNLRAIADLSAFKSNKLSLESIKENSYLMGNSSHFKTLNTIIETKVNDARKLVFKTQNQNAQVTLITISDAMPGLILDKESPLSLDLGSVNYNSVLVGEYIVDQGWIKKEVWDHPDFNQATALKYIKQEREALLTKINSENDLNIRIARSLANNQPISDSDQKERLVNNNITFDINNPEHDPYKYFVNENVKYNTISGDLEGLLSSPSTLNHESAFKMLPIIESAFNTTTGKLKDYRRKHKNLLEDQISREGLLFWKDYLVGIKADIEPRTAFDEAIKNHNNRRDGEENKRKVTANDAMYAKMFEEHEEQFVDEELGQKSIPLVGNLIPNARALLDIGRIGFGLGPKTDMGMDETNSYLDKDLNPVTERKYTNDANGRKQYFNDTMKEFMNSNIGLIPYLKSNGNDDFTDSRARAIEKKWGSLGDLANMNIPSAVLNKAMLRVRKRYDLDRDVYKANPGRRDGLIVTSIIEILDENGYMPELTSQDGLLATQEGFWSKGYNLKWSNNSILNAAQNSGWEGAGVRWNPRLAQGEIAMHMNNSLGWNKNPDKPGEYLYPPSYFGDYNNFHDVPWMIKTNGNDDQGDPIAEIYWYDNKNKVVKKLVANVLDKEGKETGQTAGIMYPYKYKDSFYKSLAEDQQGKLQKFYNENKWLQNEVAKFGYETLTEAYLNGFNLGLSDMSGKSPQFMKVLLEIHREQDILNGLNENSKNVDPEKPRNKYRILNDPRENEQKKAEEELNRLMEVLLGSKK